MSRQQLAALLMLLAVVATLTCGAAAAAWTDPRAALRESAKLKRWLHDDDKDALQKYYSQWAQGLRPAAGAAAGGSVSNRDGLQGVAAAERFAQFKRNLAAIVRINERANKTGWWAAPNEASDLSWEQFVRQYLGAPRTVGGKQAAAQGIGSSGRSGRKLLQTLPSLLDWTQQRKVSPVKWQGGCGGCWSFAVTAALESYQMIKKNQRVDLSEQQLIDCTGKEFGYQSRGCSGGWPTDALNYIYRFGLNTERSYPYTARTEACRFRGDKELTHGPVQITTRPGYTTVQGLSHQVLMQALTEQPVIVAFNVEDSFQHYAGGIYTADSCNATKVNHALLVTGYRAPGKSRTGWWRVKNSWGNGWGEKGYARVEMTSDPAAYPYGPCAMYAFKYQISS